MTDQHSVYGIPMHWVSIVIGAGCLVFLVLSMFRS